MDSVKRSLFLALLVTFGFMLLEGIGGFIAGSLAMLGDAAHMMTDAASFAVSLAAVYLAERGATSTMTFGHGRVEVLAALSSTLAIWLVTGLLVGEAVRRISAFARGEAEPVNGPIMTILGLFGVGMNVVLERVLGGHEHGGHSHSHGHCHSHHKSQELVPKQKRSFSDVESGHGHDHGHESGHDHGHGHDHDESGHDHGHGHSEHRTRESNSSGSPRPSTERTRLGATAGGQYAAVPSEENAAPASSSRGPPTSWLSSGVNMNLDAAYLHVLGDLVQSLGVVVAGVLIWIRPDWQVADPICTLFFAVIVLITTFSMLNRTINVLLQGVPEHIDVDALEVAMCKIDGVCDVHDLHVWELTPGRVILTVHVGVDPDSSVNQDSVLAQTHKVAEDAGIEYSTIQVQKMRGCAAKTCFTKPKSPTHSSPKSPTHSSPTQLAQQHVHTHAHAQH